MLIFIAIVHVIVALLLILFVLLQDSKGGAMGVLSGGGGSNTVFGSTGAGNFLSTTTKWLAVIFAMTCISLMYITTQKGSSVLDDVAPAESLTPSSEVIDTTKGQGGSEQPGTDKAKDPKKEQQTPAGQASPTQDKKATDTPKEN